MAKEDQGKKLKKVQTKRRDFIKYSTIGFFAVATGVGAFGGKYLIKKENRLRPPGALEEHDFLALCIKCGQCLQVCPYHSIKLSDIVKGAGVGTPYIDPTVRACYACNAVPCVLACPSGALDHACSKPEDIHMGVAVLEHPDTCLAIKQERVPKNYLKKMKTFTETVRNKTPEEDELLKRMSGYEGKECTLCADVCPIPNPITAIAMVPHSSGGQKPEIYDGCIGCGACEDVCPTLRPSIVIKPRAKYEDIYKS